MATRIYRDEYEKGYANTKANGYHSIIESDTSSYEDGMEDGFYGCENPFEHSNCDFIDGNEEGYIIKLNHADSIIADKIAKGTKINSNSLTEQEKSDASDIAHLLGVKTKILKYY